MRVIHGKSHEIPKEYQKELFTFSQQSVNEFFKHFIKPIEIERYEIDFFAPANDYEDKIWVLAINQENELSGFASIYWRTKYDNLDSSYIHIYVTKEKRREKIGTELLKEVLKLLPPQIVHFSLAAREDSVGELFIKSFTSQKASYRAEVNVAKLEDFNLEEVRKEEEKMRLDAEKKGFGFVFVDGINFEEELKKHEITMIDFAYMIEQIWNDMPREESTQEDSVVTPERYQELYEQDVTYGKRKNKAIIVYDKETKKPVGISNIFLDPYDNEVINQDDTGVIHEYRGKKLGYTLKLMILKEILEKHCDAKYWMTFNAASNSYMIHVNRLLKHEPLMYENVYEFRKEEMLKKFDYI